MGNARIPCALERGFSCYDSRFQSLLVGPLGYGGLALGTSIGAILNALFCCLGRENFWRREGAFLPLGFFILS